MSRMRVSLLAAGGAVGVPAVGAIVAFAGIGGDRDGDQGPVDQSQVKITAAQAQAAATRAVPGTVQSTQLRNESGSAAHDVIVRRSDGSLATVDVNASNGQILRQENGVPESDDGDDG